MSSATLKWSYRSGLKAALNWKYRSGLKSLYNKIGFKFKKLKDSLLIDREYHDFEKSNIYPHSLRLNTVTMKDNLCFFCSDGNYRGQGIDRIETYAYTTYVKGMRLLPNLFNLP
jgi:hypothetical protein